MAAERGDLEGQRAFDHGLLQALTRDTVLPKF